LQNRVPTDVDARTDVLTPANYDEFRRVLSPDGMLVKVYPGQDYLREIRLRQRILLRRRQVVIQWRHAHEIAP